MIGKVEKICSEAENGVETGIFSENGAKLCVAVGFCDAVDEMLEEMVDGELSLRKIHAFWCKFRDGISDTCQSFLFILLVILMCVFLIYELNSASLFFGELCSDAVDPCQILVSC